MTPYFITATGTGIGKTLVTCSLAYQFLQQSARARVLKPVISGWDERENDTFEILKSQQVPITPESIDATSPWRFRAPLSPDMAAAHEGTVVDFEEVADFCRKPYPEDILLIEGAGGVMTPLTRTHTMLDLISALSARTLLVTGSYLGSLSHTLTALAALDARETEVCAVIVSESAGSEVPFAETLASLAQFTSLPLIPLPRLQENNAPLWKQAPDLTCSLSLQHVPQHRL